MAVAASVAAAPKAHWLEVTHNFGAFNEEMGIVTTAFKVVNTGDEPLLILSARANCGCTTPTYPKTPIAPGDTAVITVGFNPSGRIGRFEKYVAVDLNAPTGEGESGRSRQQLRISGTVIGASNTIAGRFPAGSGAMRLRTTTAAFGRVGKGKLASVSISGYNRGEDTLSLSVTDKPDYIDATIRPQRVAPGELFNVLLSLNSRDCPQWGIVTDSANLVGMPGDESVELRTVGIVTDDFSKMSDSERAKAPVLSLSAESLDFNIIARNHGELKQYLRVSNDGESTLKLRRIYTSDPAIRIEPTEAEIKPGKNADVTVIVDTNKVKPPMLNARIMLVSNDPGNAQTSVRCVGEVK